MMKKLVWLVIVTASIYGCKSSDAKKDFAYRITLVEQEKFVEPFKTRVIVTPEFMRFDDGEGDMNFILFDRKKNVIYSVNSSDKNVIVINQKNTVLEPPYQLDVKLKKIGALKDSPKINNETAIHYQVMVNDKLCYNVATISNLMPEAVAALRDYAILAASDSMSTYSSIPADMQNPCEGAMTTFTPVIHMQNGFPVMEWGRQREIVKQLFDYDLNFVADPSLFVLPPETEYHHFNVQDMREGKVKFN